MASLAVVVPEPTRGCMVGAEGTALHDPTSCCQKAAPGSNGGGWKAVLGVKLGKGGTSAGKE